jgi:hypothetical protein
MVNFLFFGGLSLTPFLSLKNFPGNLMLLFEPLIHRRVCGDQPSCRFLFA